jgi:hypothetical protein
MTERMSWAEYREAHGVTDAEEQAAFAAYPHYVLGGQCDGAAQPRDADGEPPAAPEG